MADELEPKLNVVNLSGELGKLMALVEKFSDPATLAQLESEGKLALDDAQKLMADAQQASIDLNAALAALRLVAGI
jgi:hypothetical protein